MHTLYYTLQSLSKIRKFAFLNEKLSAMSSGAVLLSASANKLLSKCPSLQKLANKMNKKSPRETSEQQPHTGRRRSHTRSRETSEQQLSDRRRSHTSRESEQQSSDRRRSHRSRDSERQPQRERRRSRASRESSDSEQLPPPAGRNKSHSSRESLLSPENETPEREREQEFCQRRQQRASRSASRTGHSPAGQRETQQGPHSSLSLEFRLTRNPENRLGVIFQGGCDRKAHPDDPNERPDFVVVNLQPGTTAASVLQQDDILLAVNDMKVDGNRMTHQQLVDILANSGPEPVIRVVRRGPTAANLSESIRQTQHRRDAGGQMSCEPQSSLLSGRQSGQQLRSTLSVAKDQTLERQQLYQQFPGFARQTPQIYEYRDSLALPDQYPYPYARPAGPPQGYNRYPSPSPQEFQRPFSPPQAFNFQQNRQAFNVPQTQQALNIPPLPSSQRPGEQPRALLNLNAAGADGTRSMAQSSGIKRPPLAQTSDGTLGGSCETPLRTTSSKFGQRAAPEAQQVNAAQFGGMAALIAAASNPNIADASGRQPAYSHSPEQTTLAIQLNSGTPRTFVWCPVQSCPVLSAIAIVTQRGTIEH